MCQQVGQVSGTNGARPETADGEDIARGNPCTPSPGQTRASQHGYV